MTTLSRPSQSLFRPLVLLLFFASGLSSLVYEVVWMRHLSLVFGNTVYATATVLAGFMGGLAVGSLYFGRRADRTPNPLRLYGVLELLVAVFAVLFPWVLQGLVPFYVWFAKVSGASYHCLSLAQSALLVGILIVPTALMGGTLPVLTKFLGREFNSFGKQLGWLYGLNTFGAVLGCAAAGFWLLGSVGVRHTTWIAVAINVAIGVTAIILSRKSRFTAEPSAVTVVPEPAVQEETAAPHPAWLRPLALSLLAVAGFVAMAYEVLWTRILSFLTGGTTYSFTTMLTTYLLGLALGSLIIARYVDRTRKLITVFAVLQVLIGLVVLATTAATTDILLALGDFLFRNGVQRFSDVANFTILEATISMVFIFPGTLLMGMAFPVVARLCAVSYRQAGSTIGLAYFADTAGAIGGSLAAGFLLIPWLGTLDSVRGMAVVNLLVGAVALGCTVGFGSAGIRFSRSRLLVALVGVVVVFLVTLRTIPQDTFTAVFTAPGATLTYISEDIGGTVTVEQYPEYKTISINGVNVAGTDLRFETTQKLQAHLALLMHPHAESVLQIGFGSGGTAWSVSRHPLKEIDCVEIATAILRARGNFRDINSDALKDPRVKVCVDDARSYLVKCNKKYDAILSDSIHPRRAGNGGLYATDYYRLCREHLNPDGIFSAWLPMHGLSLDDFRVATRSLKQVFPHVYLFHTPVGRNEWTIILGMQQPMLLSPEEINKKLGIPAVRDDLRLIHMERVEDILDSFMIGDETLGRFLGPLTALNTDDLPYLEYVTPRATFQGNRETLLIPLYSELIRNRGEVFGYLPKGVPVSDAIRKSFASSEHVLQARLLEMENPGDRDGIRKELRAAVELDPQNHVIRDLWGRTGK